ncbi:hypothetical protein NM208_g5430 [Fusarium decemcellulare]|uniref:Uncharacterized protein n=1 Tax=Fusarium decemcellulare TaxID=57161 RepID=A0ACC1SGY2_9HYPO|nr:hypothetical protein NM208_g5430 [Fusarium decemcellulare]
MEENDKIAAADEVTEDEIMGDDLLEESVADQDEDNMLGLGASALPLPRDKPHVERRRKRSSEQHNTQDSRPRKQGRVEPLDDLLKDHEEFCKMADPIRAECDDAENHLEQFEREAASIEALCHLINVPDDAAAERIDILTDASTSSCNPSHATEYDPTVSAQLNDLLKRMIESRDKKAQDVKALDAVRYRAKLDEEQPSCMKVLELREKVEQLDSQRCDLHKRILKASNDGTTRSDDGGACSIVEDSGAEDTAAFLDGAQSSRRSTFSQCEFGIGLVYFVTAEFIQNNGRGSDMTLRCIRGWSCALDTTSKTISYTLWKLHVVCHMGLDGEQSLWSRMAVQPSLRATEPRFAVSGCRAEFKPGDQIQGLRERPDAIFDIQPRKAVARQLGCANIITGSGARVNGSSGNDVGSSTGVISIKL